MANTRILNMNYVDLSNKDEISDASLGTVVIDPTVLDAIPLTITPSANIIQISDN